MIKNRLVITLLFLATNSCQSSSLLPFTDHYEINQGKSILSSYTCEDLIEKAEDKEFSLKNLAALRAMARCPSFKFNLSELSDLEKKLYAREIDSFSTDKKNEKSNSNSESMTLKQIKKALSKEKNAEAKFALYKQLRAKIKKTHDRKAYADSTEQMYKWARKNFKSAKKKSEAREIYYDAAQIYARTFWTDDDGETALKAIDEAIKSLGSKQSLAELFLIKARILDESKEYTEAVKFYDLTLSDVQLHSPKSSVDTNRIMWLKSWILYKEKNYEAAGKAFSDLAAAANSDISERSRSQFYQARCLKALGKEEEAKAILEQVSQYDFFGYYGLVSYYELGKKLPPLSSFKPSGRLVIDSKLELIPEVPRKIFTDLIKYREYNLAERAISFIATSKDEEVNLAVYIANKARLYLPAFRIFSKLDNDDRMELFLKHPEVIFPRPYQDQVDEMAAKTNLPASLIYSIMKQESAFNEKARSHADAMGLMQVIPRLAKQLSQKFEVPFRANDDLFDPTINIQLGSYELMEQVKKQNGQLTYVAAAYNAGPNALSSWLKNRKRDDMLEFIEEIPYEETRTYVKLIARNKVFYERISKRDDEHEFPANFLN